MTLFSHLEEEIIRKHFGIKLEKKKGRGVFCVGNTSLVEEDWMAQFFTFYLQH